VRLYEKGVKWISSAILLLLTIYVGTFSINLSAFAKDNSDVIYVTERANTKDNTYVRYNNNDTRVANKVIGPDNIDEISNDEVNNICVDGNLIDKENIRQTLLNKYNSHSTIIIRKDDYTPKEIYDYFGESELSSLVTDSPYNDIKNNKLKVVAISIRKDYSGGVHATVISVENYNSEEAIEKAISYTILSKTNYSKEEKIVSLFEFNNNVYAASWNNVNTLAWSDSWDTVNVSFSITLKKYSDNPVSNVTAGV
jgi:hypothetical protein